jgi:membrane-bound serine protease (ClpP class)
MLRALTPDQALLMLTFGVLLIYVELNRPGLIVPGALGLLAVLLAIAPFLRHPPPMLALLLLAAAVLTFARALRRHTDTWLLIAATICLTDGFRQLPTHLFIALPCGLLLGVVTSYLAGIAHRARTNKGLA